VLILKLLSHRKCLLVVLQSLAKLIQASSGIAKISQYLGGSARITFFLHNT
jgi:hypothetical protein